MRSTAEVRIWRRDGAPRRAITPNQDGSIARLHHAPGVSPSVRRAKRKTSVTLLPITPLPEVESGRLDVNNDQLRVVYLAPITSTSAAKYLSRTKDECRSNSDSDASDLDDEGNSDDADKPKKPATRSPVPHTLLKLLEQGNRRKSTKDSAELRRSVFEVPRARSPQAQSMLEDREEDDQLERLRQQVHSMPTSNKEKSEFWETMKNYQRLKMSYRASMSDTTRSTIGFNMEAAWDKELLLQRHQLWVRAHDTRMEECRARKAEEDEKYEQRILESTTEHRAKMRLLREVRMRLTSEVLTVLPTIMLAAATQRMLEHLQRHWRAQQFQTRLRGIIRLWCKHRSARSSNEKAAVILINWLQKSVAVKSVAFRVFRGIRNVVRRVKVVQRLWKVKQAKRRLTFLLLEKMWIDEETTLVDRANEAFGSQQRITGDKRSPVHKKKKTKAAAPAHRNEKWLTCVELNIRAQIIRDFIKEKEREFWKLFRQQEEDLFPHLVQTLRGENPNRARSYIKAMASQSAILGRVYVTLGQFPGAVDDVNAVKPYDMHLAPIRDLIMLGRDTSPLDPTEQSSLNEDVMQADSLHAAYATKFPTDDQKELWAQFLERRLQFRSTLPKHPADEAFNKPVVRLTSADAPMTADPATLKQSQPQSNQIPHQVTGQSEVAPDVVPDNNRDIRSNVAFGLVIVCSSFRHLPSLSDKTKEVANQLYEALVDTHFARFSRRGTKLLINPSVIEFQDAMKEIKAFAETDGANGSFFMCLSTHGARVTSGVNEGSFVLFSESRLSSEDELLLTAIHEHDLAKMIHEIPCTNKLLALELCQAQQAKEKPENKAPTIVNRVHEKFTTQLYKQLVQLELAKTNVTSSPPLTEADLLSSTSDLFNTVVLDSCCVTKNETPVRDREDQVSNFLHRLNDAFQGAAQPLDLEGDGSESSARRQLTLRQACSFVQRWVTEDAVSHNALIKAEYSKQLRTKYEAVAEFHDITQTPQVLGYDRARDFYLGDAPCPPMLAPAAPRFHSSTLSTITVEWNNKFIGFPPSTSLEVPGILGYHLQVEGDGRAQRDKWRRACDFQVLSYERIVRDHTPPPSRAVVRGLTNDMGYRFRIRARTAGGWGSFSACSEVCRTKSYASTLDIFSTVASAFEARGAPGVAELMQRYQANGDIQRECVAFVARLVLKDPPRIRAKPDRRLLPGLDTPIIQSVIEAVHAFSHDFELARSACDLIGALAQSNDAWRRALLQIHDPCPVRQMLDEVTQHFESTQLDISSRAQWARDRLRGVSAARRISPDTAARRIQGFYRTRKARQQVSILASAVYTRLVDPTSGQHYFLNTRTGATSWGLPAFIGTTYV